MKQNRFILLFIILIMTPWMAVAQNTFSYNLQDINDPYPDIYESNIKGLLPYSFGFNAIEQSSPGQWVLVESFIVECENNLGPLGYNESYSGQHIFTAGYAMRFPGYKQERSCNVYLDTGIFAMKMCNFIIIGGFEGQSGMVKYVRSANPQLYGCVYFPTSANIGFESQIMLHAMVLSSGKTK